MIGWVQGTVKTIHEHSITLLAGPIGLEIYSANPLSYKQNQQIELFIHLHWNQEQGPTLYGFATQEEKLVFLSIISCSGIGPKLALGILGHCGAASFVQAIAQEEIKTLSNIPGIGKKKAEQLIVNLKHKVAKLVEKGIVLGNTNLSAFQQISEVLTSLNYSRQEITSTLDYLKKSNDDSTFTFDLMLRKALSFLSKRA
jgi:holliday junction DNA helicase RuvA